MKLRPLLCILLLSCSAEQVTSAVQAIYTGDGVDTGSTSFYPSVVSLNSGGCTGTLITPSHILTAAHCVEFTTGNPTIHFQGDSMGDPDVRVARCAVMPKYTESRAECIPSHLLAGRTPAEAATAFGSRCGVTRRAARCGSIDPSVDFAVLQLERPIPHAIAVVSVAAGSTYVTPSDLYRGPASVSVPATAVGFGHNTQPGQPTSGAGIRRWRAIGNLAPTSIVTAFLQVIVEGDSGGPLFGDFGGGVTELMGVASARGQGTSLWGGLGEEFGGNAGIEFIDDQTDRNGDGRYDTVCGGGLVRGAEIGLSLANDTDGDGYSNSEDTCPAVYNPCQLSGDSDGDGVPNDCDACPFDSGELRARGTVLPDADGDGTPDSCDCEPSIPENFVANDLDSDFVTDACDNCPSISNPNQSDLDTDSAGDACDLCPNVLEPQLALGLMSPDSDLDGTPNACDNCENLPNPSQLNCNLDAEVEEGVAPVGDACDPLPCAETELIGSFDTTSNFYEVDRLLVDARIEAGAENDYATGFRICPCEKAGLDTLAGRENCRLEALTGDMLRSGGCVPGQIGRYTNPVEDHPWRWAAVSDVSGVAPELSTSFGGPDELLLAHGPPPGAMEAPSFELATNWRLDNEIPRWQALAQQEIDDGVPLALRRFPNEESKPPLRQGVLWSHTPRYASGKELSPLERRLTGHYWSGELPDPFGFIPAPQHDCLLHIGPYIGGNACTLCGSFPAPYFSLGGDFIDTCGGMNLPPVLDIPDFAVDLADVLGIDPREAFLQPDLEWLTPAEPVERLEPGTVRLVSRRVDGSGVEHAYVNTPSGLVEQWTPVAGPCSPASNCVGADLGRFANQHGWATRSVLSATRGQVFSYAGGIDGGAYQGGVAVRSLTSTTLQHATPGVLSEGVAVAMTYRMEDQSLYVLLRDDLDGKMHLARIAADFSTDEVLATYSLGSNDTFGLAVDTYGALWVSASKVGQGHQVCRFTRNATYWEPQGQATGAGDLANVAMTANRIGLSLVVRVGGRERIVGHEAEALATLHKGHEWVCF